MTKEVPLSPIWDNLHKIWLKSRAENQWANKDSLMHTFYRSISVFENSRFQIYLCKQQTDLLFANQISVKTIFCYLITEKLILISDFPNTLKKRKLTSTPHSPKKNLTLHLSAFWKVHLLHYLYVYKEFDTEIISEIYVCWDFICCGFVLWLTSEIGLTRMLILFKQKHCSCLTELLMIWTHEWF